MTTTKSEGPVEFHDAGGPEGQTFGGYELEAELGRGGMGVVYKALQRSLKRTVALKMLTGAVSRQDLTRFLAEAETAARLHHGNIVHIYEVGEKNGVPFFAMEFVEGGSLADRLKNGPLSARDAAAMMATVARGVQFAHEHGVVHRDLKPANVLLDQTGAPKIADFGIAKRLDPDATTATVTGAVMGTPGYMAPEQAEGSSHKAGPTSDVYALGAMLYELLTGRPPFVPHESDVPIYVRIVSEPPVSPAFHRPDVPRDLEAICMMCLQKDKRDRFQTASELADDLDRFLADEPIKARPPPVLRRSFRWVRRHPWIVAAGVLALFGASFGLRAWWRWEMWERPRTEHAASVEIRRGGLDPVMPLDEDGVRRRGIHVRMTRQGRRGPIVKAEVLNAKGRPAVVRDLLGFDFLQTWLQGVAGFGGFTAKGRETVTLEAAYSDGEATDLTGRDRNGRVTFSAHYRPTSGTPGRTKRGIAEFRNARNYNFTMPGGASHAEFERDDAGWDTRLRFFTGTGEPARNGEGVFGYEMRREESGRIATLRNVDARGAPMPNVGGVPQLLCRWTDRGQIASVRYEDGDGRPVATAGSTGADFTYDAAGNPASIRRLLATAEGGASGGGGPQWLVHEYSCNESGEVVTITDRVEGSPGAPPFNSRLECAYDQNGFPADCRNFGSDGTLLSRTLFRYDERGNRTEEKRFDVDGDLVAWSRRTLDADGYPVLIEELDDEGKVEERTVSVYQDDRLVRTSFEHPDGSPRPVGYGQTRVECRYHPNGYLTEERFFGFADKITLKASYDDLDRRTSDVWLDENERPVRGVQGWAWRKLTYRGSTSSVLAEVYEDPEGKPARSQGGYTALRNTYDAAGVLVAQSVEGYDGSQGYATKRGTFDVQGRLRTTEFFDASGGKAWCTEGHHRLRILTFDGAGNPWEVVAEEYDPKRFTYFRVRSLESWKGSYMARMVMKFEDREGRPAPGPDGCPELDREFDSDGREAVRTLSGCPPDESGVTAWRQETEWGEDGTVRRRIRQALDAGKRPLAEAGPDRPSRFEETLDGQGNVRKLVRRGYRESTCGYATIEAELDAEGDITAIAHRKADGTPVAVRAVVVEIAPDAQKAAKDLRIGDVLASVNGRPVSSAQDFARRGAFPGGWMEVLRDGQRVRIDGFEPGKIGIAYSDRAVK